MRYLVFFYLLLQFVTLSFGQTASDALFVSKGGIRTSLDYNYNTWSKYWEGDTLRENGNVGSVSHQGIAAGFNIGIIDRLNFIVFLPYIVTKASQGTLNGQNGLQDINLSLKGNYGALNIANGQLKFIGSLNFSTPITSYLVDFAPLNIGMGTTNYSYRHIVAYRSDKDYYINLKANYTYCSNIKNIHREFYYDQNEAYYTDEVAMNDVFDWSLVAGFSKEKFLAELSFNSHNTLGGGDIRVWEPGFPTNNMDLLTIGGRFDYYLSKPMGLNLSSGIGYCLSGKNAGKSIYASIGLSYLIRLWSKADTTE